MCVSCGFGLFRSVVDVTFQPGETELSLGGEPMDVGWSNHRYVRYVGYLLLWTTFVVFMLEYAGMIDLVRGLPGWR